MTNQQRLALSLFSGAGIGDIGFRAAGYDVVGFCELEGDRLGIAKANFPRAEFFVGDIWQTKNEIVERVRSMLRERGGELSLISCTAPCQGMSKNGQGTLLRNIREGKRPPLDPRNRLIIPALEVIRALRPKVVVFENVTEMRRTIIEDDDGNYKSILEVIRSHLNSEYVGQAYDVEFANYGIPQRRQRLITVFSRLQQHHDLLIRGLTLIPAPTHSKNLEQGKSKWVSVTEALVDFPPLDSKSKPTSSNPQIPFHRVPVLDALKYYWVSNTPVGKSAFDNQCAKCGFDGNAIHSTGRGSDGINRPSKDTPLHCGKCGEMLPRPSTENPDGTRRIMSGYTSAYKRMSPDLPAPALTRNFSFPCSDQKIHPFQSRVLSIAEAMRIHTISDYDFRWTVVTNDQEKDAADGLIRLVIGESIPPGFLELLGKYLIQAEAGEIKPNTSRGGQPSLFDAQSA